MKLKAISLNAKQPFSSNTKGNAGPGASSAAPNPFVGLRPFESTESLLFFGRREQTVELLQRLHDARFLSIVGSSGCGKSSLIRAGLIPKLKAGFLAGRRDQWHIATMKPGDAPLQNLASALLEAFSEAPLDDHLASLTDAIRDSGLQAIVDYLSVKLSRSSANVLLLVDQFEEIFRFGLYTDREGPKETTDDKEQRRDEAADFVSLMLALAHQEALPVYVVMTMRSDFLGDCDAFHGLPEAMNRSQYLVPRLTRQQRQEAIESPIQLYGAEITPRLVDRVLNDVGDESDQLPVMQHALMRTWEKWQEEKKGPIDFPHYEATGTVKEALSRDADKALEGMSQEELFIAERLFQALTDTDVKGRRLRRPVHLSEVKDITGGSREMILAVIEHFRGKNRAFLTISQDRIKQDPLIDISHESLIRQWATLRAWADAETKSKELYMRLAAAAVRYYEGDDVLWSGPALQTALEWKEKRQPNEAWARRYHPQFALAMKFLEESRQAHEARVAQAERDAAQKLEFEKAQAIARQKAVAARRLSWLAAALGIMFLLSSATVVYAFRARGQAIQSAKEAAEANDRASRIAQEIANEREAQALESARVAEERRLMAEEARKREEEVSKKLSQNLVTEKQLKEKAEKETKRANEQTKLAAERLITAQNETAKALRAQKDLEIANEKLAKTQAAIVKIDQFTRQAYQKRDEGDLKGAQFEFFAALRVAEENKDSDSAARINIQMADMYISQAGNTGGGLSNNRDLGIGYLRDAVRIYEEAKNYNGAAATQDKLGQLYISVKMLKEGTDALKAAVDNYRRAANLNRSAELLSRLGRLTAESLWSNTGEDNQELKSDAVAMKYFCQSREDYRKANNLEGQIAVTNDMGDLIAAIPVYIDGDIVGGEEKDRKPLAHAQETELVGCENEKPDAIKYYAQAADLYRKLMGQKPQRTFYDDEDPSLPGLRREYTSLLIKTGALYLRKGDKEKAVKSFDSAVEVYHELATSSYSESEDFEGEVSVLMRIGHMVFEKDEALADKYYGRAIQVYDKARQPEKAAYIITVVGRRYQAKGLRDRSPAQPLYLRKSLGYYEQALQISLSAHQRADMLASIGSVHALLGQDDKALESYKSALPLYETAKNLRGMIRAYEGMGAAYARLKNNPEAIAAYKAALQLARASGDTVEEQYINRALRPLIGKSEK